MILNILRIDPLLCALKKTTTPYATEKNIINISVIIVLICSAYSTNYVLYHKLNVFLKTSLRCGGHLKSVIKPIK